MENTANDLYKSFLSDQRLTDYRLYEQLYNGDHFAAFAIQSKEFKDQYAKLRYVVCNFAGLVSRVIADMLFGEPVKFKDDANQDFIDALVFENKMDVLNLEHAVANSYFGDNIYKIRVENNIIKLEDNPPTVFFPEVNKSNVKADPKRINLLWIQVIGATTYFFVETHEPPTIKLKIYSVTKPGEPTSELIEVDLPTFNEANGTSHVPEVDTKINRFLVKHVPNPKPRGYFGQSDYLDIKPLLFALNNRVSKIDNVLDKHSDPILAVPEGVLDEKGNVKKEALQMFEVPADGTVKPEYITWNANLDSAFKEIDKLVEFLFMFSETSPDVLGLGTGGSAESGRALKMKLLRTIAKRNRKKLYYDHVLKDLIYTAELLAEANPEFKASKDLKAEVGVPDLPALNWEDGIVNDEVERTTIETMKIEAGIMSKKRAIITLEDVEEDEADAILEEIKTEGESSFNSFVDNAKNQSGVGDTTGKNGNNNSGGNNNMPDNMNNGNNMMNNNAGGGANKGK